YVYGVISVYLRLRPPRPTRFPYTTLFRSGLDYQRRKAKVSYDGGTVSPVNPYAASRPVANYSFYHQYDESRRLEQTGLYVQDLRSEEHTSELQSRENLVCRLLLEKKK